MSAILVGVTGPVFGTLAETGMYVNNIEETNERQETLLQDGSDDIVAAAYTAEKGELSMDYSISNPTNAPALTLVGHNITIADSTHFTGAYIVKTVTKTRSRGQWMSGKLTASRFPSALSTTSTTTT